MTRLDRLNKLLIEIEKEKESLVGERKISEADHLWLAYMEVYHVMSNYMIEGR